MDLDLAALEAMALAAVVTEPGLVPPSPSPASDPSADSAADSGPDFAPDSAADSGPAFSLESGLDVDPSFDQATEDADANAELPALPALDALEPAPEPWGLDDAPAQPGEALVAMPVSEEPDDAPHEPRSAPPAAEKTSAGDWVEGTGEPWDDIGLKLDLARAYLEMDDPDAARTILDEVVAEGRDDQRREAESLLAGLER